MRFFNWLNRPKPDPERFLAELHKSIAGGGFTKADRYRDFRAVFQGHSTPEQGMRVLWELQKMGKMYANISPDDPQTLGKRNFILEIFTIMNMEPSDKNEAPKNITKKD